jgi:SPIRAL1-like protein
MSRGGSAGGGSSQLGYLFGGGDDAPKPKAKPAAPATSAPPAENPAPPKADVTKQVAAGVTSQTNNYHRADGQNTGNFLTVCWFPSFSYSNLFDTFFVTCLLLIQSYIYVLSSCLILWDVGLGNIMLQALWSL